VVQTKQKETEEIQNNYKSSLTDWIDDATYGRFDKRKSALSLHLYLGEKRLNDLLRAADDKILEGIRQNKPGLGLKDRALLGASRLVQGPERKDFRGPNRPNVGFRSWKQISDLVSTPQELGMPKYEGNPEETAKIIKHVARNFGACRTGITGLDKRHVYRYECDGKETVFEPVEEPYETEHKRVIPEKCKYVVVMLVQMPREAFAQVPFPVGNSVPLFTYTRIDMLAGAVAEFIRKLGYTAIPSANDTASNIPLAIEAGLGELSRTDRLVNPAFGSMVRICKVITDLPMELDNRRCFGIVEFCKVCQRCAEACPAKAVNTEREPSFKAPGPWTNPGHKAWFGKSIQCWSYAKLTGGSCGICLSVCPWNKPKGLLHTIVKAVIKRTSFFNRFFVAADKLFGYGKPANPESWWKRKLSTYGIDTHR